MNLTCRFCEKILKHSFMDLGMSPFSNAYISQKALTNEEIHYPLHAYVCSSCLLVQIQAHAKPDSIFLDYAYFSSFSTSWLKHAQQFVKDMTSRLHLTQSSQIIEIASNDGYLLQYFPDNFNCLGIEPAENIAAIAREKGIDTRATFFSNQVAKDLVAENKKADLIVANNVLAHVPNLNDFVEGLSTLIHSEGTISIEVPHLLELCKHNQFDTIYHEHYSYFSLITLIAVFRKYNLKIYDVKKLKTHGGSMRLLITPESNTKYGIEKNVPELLLEEKSFGLDKLATYLHFQDRILNIKTMFWDFIIKLRKEEKSIAAYGAPAKGNTFLNYCGIDKYIIPFCVDKSPHKQGLYLPGSHIPILSPNDLISHQPDYILILPWNLKKEIKQQLAEVKKWGGRFVTAIPELKIHDI